MSNDKQVDIEDFRKEVKEDLYQLHIKVDELSELKEEVVGVNANLGVLNETLKDIKRTLSDMGEKAFEIIKWILRGAFIVIVIGQGAEHILPKLLGH